MERGFRILVAGSVCANGHINAFFCRRRCGNAGNNAVRIQRQAIRQEVQELHFPARFVDDQRVAGGVRVSRAGVIRSRCRADGHAVVFADLRRGQIDSRVGHVANVVLHIDDCGVSHARAVGGVSRGDDGGEAACFRGQTFNRAVLRQRQAFRQLAAFAQRVNQRRIVAHAALAGLDIHLEGSATPT